MKNILIIIIIGFSVSAFSNFKTTKTIESGDCQYGQCYKIKDDGYRCKNCCQQYSSYCWSHKNQ